MIQTEIETQKKRPLKKYTRLDDLKIRNFKPDKNRDYKKADEKAKSSFIWSLSRYFSC